LQVVKEYAKRNSYKIVKVFEEKAVSGTKDIDERPAFQQMMSEILADGVKTVIIEGLDRLAREYRIQETLAVYLASKEVNLISARTGENITEAIEGDPLRKALVQIQAIMFELEKNQALLRMRKGKERARAEGRRAEGQHRYGEDSEEERRVIKRIRYMRRTRRGGHAGLSYAKIAEQLNSEGIPTKKGRKWTAALVHHIDTSKKHR
jgi:DNA invertase Pin-like site-specific DNA recombinase